MKQEWNYSDNVFINCPFDEDYKPFFDAIVFTVFDCGFRPRCALESQDASELRIHKIRQLISECSYGIHDLSRVELDEIVELPRFNMPFELGVFLGAKWFGEGLHKTKKCLILDRDKYRYRKYISDISGLDIRAHSKDLEELITGIRDWLRDASNRTAIPSGDIIWSRYQRFLDEVPELCKIARLNPEKLTFNDYSWIVSEWLKADEVADTL